MRKYFLLFLCFTPLFLFGQQQEKFARVALEIERPDLIAYLQSEGFDIDHAYKNKKNQFEVLLPQSDVDRLEGMGLQHQILIPDAKAHFLAQAAQSAGSRDVSCGLINYTAGSLSGYTSFAEMQTHIINMQTQFPDLVEVSTIGTSLEGRSIFSVKISDNVATNESATEAVVYYDALTHAREPMGLEVSLYYMWYLLENYGSDPEATYLIDNREIYFVPVVNPDGVVHNETTDPLGGGFWRKNRKPNSNGCIGVDLNRNFDANWGQPGGSSNDECQGTYRGSAPFSEPETQVIRDFLLQIQPASSLSIHSYGQLYIYSGDFTNSSLNYETLSEYASEFTPLLFSGYGSVQQMLAYGATGTTVDYLNNQGSVSYSPEVGLFFWEDPSEICGHAQDMLESMLYISWLAGDFLRFHDFEIVNDIPIWEGYTNELKIRIKNKGISGEAQNVRVELSSTNPGINFINSSVNYGNVTARQFAEDASFSFKTETPLSLGEALPINVRVYQDENLSDEHTFYLYAGLRNVLFEDDGENDLVQWQATNWDTTFVDSYNGEHCITDSRYDNTEYETSSNIKMLNSVQIFSPNKLYLEYHAKWSLEPEIDYVELLISTDNGQSWGNLTTPNMTGGVYTNNVHWVQEQIDLSSVQTSPIQIGFNIETDLNLRTDGFYFDDFKFVDYSEPPPSSVHSDNRKYSLSLAPNPASDFITLEIDPALENYSIRLLDLQGRSLIETNSNSISIAEIPNGIYYVEVLAKDFTWAGKVIVIK